MLKYFILILFVILSPNPLSIAYAGVVLIWILNTMWRHNEPKVLLISLVIYWMNTSLLLLSGIFSGTSLTELSISAPNTIIAANFLALTALLVYTEGIRRQIIDIKPLKITDINIEIAKYDSNKLLYVYIAYSIFAGFLNQFLLRVSFGQIFIGFIQLKWTILALLIIDTITQTKNRIFVFSTLFAEILLSFSGFWANFKDYIIIIVAVLLTFLIKIKLKTFIYVSVVGLFTFIVAVIWTVSKGEYRQYLTGGKRTQHVTQINRVENLTTLAKIIENKFSYSNYKKNIELGIDALVNRVSYIEYFAMAMKRVPSEIPFEDGLLLKDAINHILKPRFIFPNKKIIDDSEITSKYTGRYFSGYSEGSSFSLGSVPERYVDYGPVFMYIPIFLFGSFIGLLYKKILELSYNKIWGLCLVIPLFIVIPSYGIATTKFLSWSIYYLVAFLIFNNYVVPVLDNFLQNKYNRGK